MAIVDSLSVDLFAYDAGTEDGTLFSGDNPDSDPLLVDWACLASFDIAEAKSRLPLLFQIRARYHRLGIGLVSSYSHAFDNDSCWCPRESELAHFSGVPFADTLVFRRKNDDMERASGYPLCC